MLVKDWMTRSPITVSEDTPLLDAYRIFHEYEIRHLPVLNQGRVVGIISNRDIGKFLLDRRTEPQVLETEPVGKAMTTKVITIRPDDNVVNAAMTMHNRKISSLPVVDGNGQLQGIVTINDLLEVLVTQLQSSE